MIVFMGTPEFASLILEDLISKTNHKVGLVVTQPDKKVGRKQVLTPSSVKKIALKHGIEVFQPTKMKDEFEYILSKNPSIIITAAYGQILPKYRGGAPIQYALFNCDKKTGVTLMEMVYKMDAGDMIAKKEVLITEEDDFLTLSSKLSYVASELLLENIDRLLSNSYQSEKQDIKEVTFAYTIKKEEEKLDWYKKAKYILGHIRGLAPNVGAYTTINDQSIKVYKAQKSDIIFSDLPGEVLIQNKQIFIQTKDYAIELLQIKPAGKKLMNTKDFLNGQNLIKSKDILS